MLRAVLFQIVDFIIRSQFRKHPGQHRPPHVLCHGFERASRPDPNALQPEAPSSLSGVLRRYPNSHVEIVKGPVWSALLIALGHGGDRIMIELLMNCGIFAPLDTPSGTCYQLSGKFCWANDADISETRQENHWPTWTRSCRIRGCRISLRSMSLQPLPQDLASLGTRALAALRPSLL